MNGAPCIVCVLSFPGLIDTPAKYGLCLPLSLRVNYTGSQEHWLAGSGQAVRVGQAGNRLYDQEVR
jgi:hypothetical protein